MANNDFTNAALATTKAELGAQVVTQTLDALNGPAYGSSKCGGAGSSADISATYDFNRSVLDAFYLGKGTAIDSDG